MNNEVKPNYRQYNQQADKPFFAAYLNTALQNAFICLRDISERCALPFDTGQDGNLLSLSLWQKLKDNAQPELTEQIIGLLRQRFPFTKHLAVQEAYISHRGHEPGPAEYRDMCLAMLEQLYIFRNYYSHAVHPPYTLLPDTVVFMQVLFDAGRPLVKERFTLATKDVDHLVRLGKGGKEPYNYRYSFIKNNALTEKGLAFFTCLWLQRKSAQEFLKKLEGFKKSESPSQQATLELFTFYGLHLRQPRLTSDASSAGLLLDMVNELKRCPAALYPLLSTPDRDRFKALPEDEATSLEEEYEAMPILKRSSNRFYYFALRFFDRQFKTLRFEIDLGNYCFNSYGQVIGDAARTRRWMKRMTAFGRLEDFAGERPPHWQDKVLTIAERSSTDAKVYVTDTTPHYHINNFTIGLALKNQQEYEASRANGTLWPPLPAYDAGQKPNGNQPDMWLSLYELPAMMFYHLLQQQHPQLPTAEAIVAAQRKKIKSFFAVVASGQLASGSCTPAGLDALLAEKGLERQQVPKAILQYLQGNGQPDYAAKAARLLQTLIDETKERISKVAVIKAGAKQRPGSKDYTPLKNGHLADFIARDMLLLQPATDTDKGKANGTEFQVLQASIAYFAANKASLPALFALCNLTGSGNPHPFLQQIDVQQCNGLLDFYTAYLDKRLGFLQAKLKEGHFAKYHFLKLSREKQKPADTYIKELAAKLNDSVVINLPRGLFLQPLLTLLKADAAGAAVAAEAAAMQRVNTAWLIDAYFKQVRQDGPQAFYQFGRAYELLDKLYDTRSKNEMRKALPHAYHTPAQLATMQVDIMERLKQKTNADLRKPGKNRPLSQHETASGISDANWRAYKYFTEDEKDIRWNKTCDMVLFMMADELLRKEFLTDGTQLKKQTQGAAAQVNIGEGYKLAAIAPDAESSLLALQTSASIAMPYRFETSMAKILYVDGATSVPGDVQYKTVVQPTIKIKNYGDFRGLLKDRRITSLLPYIADETVQFDALRRELEWYEGARIKVFEKVQAFELAAATAEDGNTQIKHNTLLQRYLPADSLRFAELRQLRNAFSHSMYPDWLLFKDKVNGGQFNTLQQHTTAQPARQHSVALQLLNLVNVYYDELLLAAGNAHGQQ